MGFETTKYYRTIHGESPKNNHTRLYRIYHAMKQRTENPNHNRYADWGGRGIKICDEWQNSINFFKWARTHGYSDSLQLDRINVNGNYSPDNCRWVTPYQNVMNRRKREDYGIRSHQKGYMIKLTRNRKDFYGGVTRDITEARKMRDKLALELNSKYPV